MQPRPAEQRLQLSRRSFLWLLSMALVGCATHDRTPSSSEAIEALESGGGVRPLEDIRASGKVRVGMVPDSLPLCYLNSFGNYCGFERDVAGWPIGVKELATEVVPMDIADAYDFLANGRIDLACCACSPVDERADEAVYTFPYVQLQLGVLSATSKPFASVKELAGHVLLACEGSYAATYAKKNLPDVELRLYETYTNLYQALQAGRGDAIIADEIVLEGWAAKRSAYAVSLRELGDPRPICLAAAAQHKDLIDFLTYGLRDYILNNHMATSYERYVIKNVGENYADMLLKAPDDA